MIVYNVKRRWFTEKSDANDYRKSLGLKPHAIIKIIVTGRDDLARLLNMLCEPPLPDSMKSAPLGVQLADRIAGGYERDLNTVVDRAFVDPQREVPDFVPLFLIGDTKQRERVKADREARGWTFEMSEAASEAELRGRSR